MTTEQIFIDYTISAAAAAARQRTLSYRHEPQNTGAIPLAYDNGGTLTLCFSLYQKHKQRDVR